MEMRQHQSKIQSKYFWDEKGAQAMHPNNLFLDNNAPHVNVILIDQNKKNKIRPFLDPNELLMEFHCEV